MQATTTLKINIDVPDSIMQDLIKKKQELNISLCAGCGEPMRFKELRKDVSCKTCEQIKSQFEQTGEF